jgi:hypothetical protein
MLISAQNSTLEEVENSEVDGSGHVDSEKEDVSRILVPLSTDIQSEERHTRARVSQFPPAICAAKPPSSLKRIPLSTLSPSFADQ